jgi:hypothetical protein
MTYIKHVQRLFEVAEPAVVVTFFGGSIFYSAGSGPSPAAKRFLMVGGRATAAFRGFSWRR